MAEQLDFTIRAIEALAAPATGRIEVRDTKCQGLYLRVTASGVKSFSFVGRAKGSSRVERVTLGKFPVVKPEEARRRATGIAGQLSTGKSVAAAERERRGEFTLDELKVEYSKHLKRETKRPDNFELAYRLYIGPAFGTRRLSEIRGTDVAKWFHGLPERVVRQRTEQANERAAKKAARQCEIAARQAVRRHGPDAKQKTPAIRVVTGKRSANGALGALRAMFNWASKPQIGYFAGVNPAAGHKGFAKGERDRFLQSGELGPFFEALADEANVTARDCMLTKLLTGARKDNVQKMRWSELSLDRAEWRIPGEKTKNGDAQVVPLVDEAVALLEARKETTKSVFVFDSLKSKSGHITTTTKAWKRVLLRAGLTDVVEHDLRRTLGSWQARTGATMVIIGKSLNHRDYKSTQIYAQLDTDPVRESVTRATSAMYEAAGIKPKAVVVPLPSAAAKKKTAA